MRLVVPNVDLRKYRPAHSATRLLTKSFCEQHAVVPVSVAHGSLILAMVEPDNDSAAVREAGLFTGLKVEVVRASAEEIFDTIATCYGGAS